MSGLRFSGLSRKVESRRVGPSNESRFPYSVRRTRALVCRPCMRRFICEEWPYHQIKRAVSRTLKPVTSRRASVLRKITFVSKHFVARARRGTRRRAGDTWTAAPLRGRRLPRRQSGWPITCDAFAARFQKRAARSGFDQPQAPDLLSLS
jgi:hypothetical protein